MRAGSTGDAEPAAPALRRLPRDGSSFALPQDLAYNQWYRYRVTIRSKANDTIAVVQAFIDYDLDGTWTEVASEDYERTGFRKNDADAKYTWIRANSGDQVQAGLKLRNAAVSAVPSL